MNRSFGRHVVRLLSVIAVIALGACAGHTGGSFVPTQSAPQFVGIAGIVPVPDAVPPKCPKQVTTKKYAKDVTKLSTKGGSLCIPAIGGFGGTIIYPPANPSVNLTVISSPTNYAKLPSLGSGKAIFYMQLSISGGTQFGSNAPAGGGLTGKKIITGKTYTAFGAATADGITLPFTPCFAVAKKGKYGGQIGGLGTLLKGQSVPFAVKGYIDTYPGKQASGKC